MRGYLVNWSVRARVISWVDSLQLTTWKFLLTLHLFSAAFFVSGRAVSMERFWIKCPTWEIFQMGITQFYWMISSAECVCISLSQRNRSIEHGLLRLLPGDFPDSHPKPRPGAQLSNVGALGSTSRINSPGISAQAVGICDHLWRCHDLVAWGPTAFKDYT